MSDQNPQRGLSVAPKLPKTLAEIEQTFVRTGVITPAGGICYIHKEFDQCAAIYNGRKAKVFYNRTKGSERHEQFPVHYDDRIEIYLEPKQ